MLAGQENMSEEKHSGYAAYRRQLAMVSAISIQVAALVLWWRRWWWRWRRSGGGVLMSELPYLVPISPNQVRWGKKNGLWAIIRMHVCYYDRAEA